MSDNAKRDLSSRAFREYGSDAELYNGIHDLETTIARYERFLFALQADRPNRAALLDKNDLGEWAEEQAQTLLDGGEAECPNCCTPLHEGACAGEGEGEEDEDEDSSPECEACGDRRGQCSHSA